MKIGDGIRIINDRFDGLFDFACNGMHQKDIADPSAILLAALETLIELASDEWSLVGYVTRLMRRAGMPLYPSVYPQPAQGINPKMEVIS